MQKYISDLLSPKWILILTISVISSCSYIQGSTHQPVSGLQQWSKAGLEPFALYVPASVDASQPAPLIFVLHGSTGEGPATLKSSGMIDIAEKYGIVLVAPNGAVTLSKGYAWNIPGVITVAGTVPDNTVRDDVNYISDISDSLVSEGIVDQSRVYVMGISGGGRMSSWLACVESGRFAAAAPIVGLRAGNPLASVPVKPDPATCNPAHAIPIIAFAGNKDVTNPIEGGGPQYWQYSMKEAELRWAALNGCNAVPTSQSVSKNILETRYSNCRHGAEVITYVTDGAGHGLVADNEKIWDFFRKFQRDKNGGLKAIR